jgi:hypothetical protein
MAYDSGAPWRGPLFRVPITVVKPVPVGPAAPARAGYGSFSSEATPHFAAAFRALDFAAGAEHRRFVAVPEGATWCEMRLTAAAGLPNPCNYFVRATQLRPAQKFSDGEGARAYVQLAANQEWAHNFAVQVRVTAAVLTCILPTTDALLIYLFVSNIGTRLATLAVLMRLDVFVALWQWLASVYPVRLQSEGRTAQCGYLWTIVTRLINFMQRYVLASGEQILGVVRYG